jgi:hypothetical protein
MICRPSAVSIMVACKDGKNVEAVDSERDAIKSGKVDMSPHGIYKETEYPPPLVVSKTPTTPLPTARRAFCDQDSGMCSG